MSTSPREDHIDAMISMLSGTTVPLAGSLRQFSKDGHVGSIAVTLDDIEMTVYCTPCYDIPESELQGMDAGTFHTEIYTKDGDLFQPDITYHFPMTWTDVSKDVLSYISAVDDMLKNNMANWCFTELQSYCQDRELPEMCADDLRHRQLQLAEDYRLSAVNCDQLVSSLNSQILNLKERRDREVKKIHEFSAKETELREQARWLQGFCGRWETLSEDLLERQADVK